MSFEDYLYPFISAISGGVGGWIFGRKKERAKTNVVEGDALQSMQEGYKQMVVDTNERLKEESERLDMVEKELAECKRMNEKRSKELFIQQYASQSFGLLIVGYNGVIEYTNGRFTDYFNVSDDYFLGKNYVEFLSKKDAKKVQADWNDSKHLVEIHNYKSTWIVAGVKYKCFWLKTFNNNFNKTTYTVLEVGNRIESNGAKWGINSVK